MLLAFGQVLKYKYDNEWYIFLAVGETQYYLARILSKELTLKLERLSVNPKYGHKLDYKLFNYITLATSEFKDQAAHFGDPEKDIINDFEEMNVVIETADKIKLQKEIVDSPSVVGELKYLVKNITLEVEAMN